MQPNHAGLLPKKGGCAQWLRDRVARHPFKNKQTHCLKAFRFGATVAQLPPQPLTPSLEGVGLRVAGIGWMKRLPPMEGVWTLKESGLCVKSMQKCLPIALARPSRKSPLSLPDSTFSPFLLMIQRIFSGFADSHSQRIMKLRFHAGLRV